MMVSIIIPTFNEEEKIGELITNLQKSSATHTMEILVVDAGSTDSTREIAEQAGAVVIESPQKGRARQMNYGASLANGKWLYFLHADTIPPPGFISDIKKAVRSGAKSGCFRLTFDRDYPALKFYAWFTKFDVTLFRFGDQSLFVEKELFEEIGGFDEALMVMEDQEIVHRLKKQAQFRVVQQSVCTSGRRYERIGFYKLQLIFTIIVIMYYSGFSQKTIVNFYRSYT